MQIADILHSEAIKYSVEIPNLLRVRPEPEMLLGQLLELLLGRPSYSDIDQKYNNLLWRVYSHCTTK